MLISQVYWDKVTRQQSSMFNKIKWVLTIQSVAVVNELAKKLEAVWMWYLRRMFRNTRIEKFIEYLYQYIYAWAFEWDT